MGECSRLRKEHSGEQGGEQLGSGVEGMERAMGSRACVHISLQGGSRVFMLWESGALINISILDNLIGPLSGEHLS